MTSKRIRTTAQQDQELVPEQANADASLEETQVALPEAQDASSPVSLFKTNTTAPANIQQRDALARPECGKDQGRLQNSSHVAARKRQDQKRFRLRAKVCMQTLLIYFETGF